MRRLIEIICVSALLIPGILFFYPQQEFTCLASTGRIITTDSLGENIPSVIQSDEQTVSRSPGYDKGSALPYDRGAYKLFRKIKIFAGVSLPQGAFGDNDPSQVGSGYAFQGLAAGISYTAEVVRGIGFTIGETFNYHSLDKEGWKKAFPYFYFDAEDRWLLWTTGGLMFDVDISPKLNICMTSELGFLYTNYPNITVEDGVGEQATITAPAVITRAAKFGAGMRYLRYELGINYLMASPEFKPVFTYRNDKSPYDPETKPVDSVQLTLGYIFN